MVKLSDLSINLVLKPCLRADFKTKMAKIEYLKNKHYFWKIFLYFGSGCGGVCIRGWEGGIEGLKKVKK